MVALIKLIIVMVLSVFSEEPAEENISANTHQQVEYQHQKADGLTKCDPTCILS